MLADTTTVDTSQKEPTAVASPVYPYRPARNRQHDLIHTRLAVRFDWEKHHLLGTATLELSTIFLSTK